MIGRNEASNREFLSIVKAVSEERAVDKAVVFEAIEAALAKAAGGRFGYNRDIRVSVDRETGQIEAKLCFLVVEIIENEGREITLAAAQRRQAGSQLGDVLEEQLPALDHGRIATLSARQIILKHIQEAERQRQYEEYKDRIGEISTGIVKQTEHGHLIIDLGGRAEGILRREHQIPTEQFRRNDRIRFLIRDVDLEARNQIIFLSRTDPAFMAALFRQEVPEIYDGIVEICACARDPGSRAKIAVRSRDASIDPVSVCVGVRGSRVQIVVNELSGEKIDIVSWSENPAEYIVNAIAPAEVSKIILDEDKGHVEIVLPADQQARALGRRGQNVRLASDLIQLTIQIISEDEDTKRRSEAQRERIALFIKALDVDEVLAHLLETEGFKDVEELAATPPADLQAIEGLDADIAGELLLRAREYVEQQEAQVLAELREAGAAESLLGFPHFTRAQQRHLVEKGIRSLEDFADASIEELVGPEGLFSTHPMETEQVTTLLLKTRHHLGILSDAQYEQAIQAQAERVQAQAERARHRRDFRTPAGVLRTTRLARARTSSRFEGWEQS